MTTVQQIVEFLERFAPASLAESWDNVGLLIGERSAEVFNVMTCLSVTPASVAEAVEARAQLIVTHHPFPFEPLKRVSTDTVEGRLLWQLIRNGLAVLSPHTAFDSCREGINQRLATGLELLDIRPLIDSADDPSIGTGRHGGLDTPLPLDALADRVKRFLNVDRVQVVGAWQRMIQRVAVGCGSAGDLLAAARQRGCDCFVTGEARFHTALDAEATGIALILAGHYATERFGIEALSGVLKGAFPELKVWPSQREQDPLRWR